MCVSPCFPLSALFFQGPDDKGLDKVENAFKEKGF